MLSEVLDFKSWQNVRDDTVFVSLLLEKKFVSIVGEPPPRNQMEMNNLESDVRGGIALDLEPRVRSALPSAISGRWC